MTNRPPFANLRAELARGGLRQIDVAELLGLSQPQVSQRYRGESRWQVAELQKIARHLNIPVSTLIDDEPIPADEPADEPADGETAVAS